MNNQQKFFSKKSSLNRRQFLKYMLAAASTSSMPNILGCSVFSNQIPNINTKRPFILKNANIIDVINGKVLEKHSIKMINGRILSIIPPGEALDSSIKSMDLKNKYVCPGLIDAHCHVTMTSVYSFNLIEGWRHLRQQEANLRLCIESGVTTIRDVGAMQWILEWYIDRIKNEWIIGPRVIYANSMLNIKGGHPEVNPTDINILANAVEPFIGLPNIGFSSTEQLKKILKKNSRNASFIKLTVDPTSIFCKENNIIPVYTDEHLKIIFDFAEKKSLPIVCHNMDKEAFDRMIQYPIHSLEHVVSDTFLSDKEIKNFSEKGIAVVPTLTVGQSFVSNEMFDVIPEIYQTDLIENEIKVRNHYLNNEAQKHIDAKLHSTNMNMMSYYKTVGCQEMWKQKIFMSNPDKTFGMLKYGVENLKKLKDAGVLIGVGMDAGMPFCYFGSIYRELELLSRIGFTNHEIIKAATYNNAKILKMDSDIGVISPGKIADMVIYDHNPLDDISVCRKPQMVFKEGKVMISNLDLNSFINIEQSKKINS